jgi:hypothetical protein
VGTQNDIIELNGYKYDAKTGAMLGRSSSSSAPRSIDGFSRHPVPSRKSASPKSPTPSHNLHTKVNKSKTLRREGLKKPEAAPAAPQSQAPLQKRTMQPDHARAARASQTQKHPHVSKFQANVAPGSIAVQPEPPAAEAPLPASEIKRAVLPLSPFDMAVQNATSHQQTAPKAPSLRDRVSDKFRVSTKALSVGVSVFAVLIIGIFFAKQHLSTLAVELAATRAGVEAKLPGYEPAGFSLAGPIEYSAGEIALSYQSASDDRNFTIVQKNTDWNSQALLDNFVEPNEKPFQTVQENGKTIYLYNGNNATWVSGGIWYNVVGDSSLNTDQLLRIASGL